MDKFCNSMDDLSLGVKIILALPVINIIWWVYRICKSAFFDDIVGLLIAVIILIVGIPFIWLVDIIFLLLYNKVLWFDYSAKK